MKRLILFTIVLLGTMNVMAQKEYGRISENEAKTYCQAKFHVILDEVKKGTPYPWQYNMVFQVWKKVGVVLVEDIINKKCICILLKIVRAH